MVHLPILSILVSPSWEQRYPFCGKPTFCRRPPGAPSKRLTLRERLLSSRVPAQVCVRMSNFTGMRQFKLAWFVRSWQGNRESEQLHTRLCSQPHWFIRRCFLFSLCDIGSYPAWRKSLSCVSKSRKDGGCHSRDRRVDRKAILFPQA